jgi:type II secretory pathway pseudopilin PulG
MNLNRCRRQAFSLIEVTLAIGIAAISLVTIFALLPLGVQTNQRSIEQTASADILSVVAGDLHATPVTIPRGGATISPQFHIAIPAAGSTGTPATLFFSSAGQSADSLQPDSRYRLTVTFLSNGGATKTATFANLKVTWPASAVVENAQGSAEIFAAFDRN